MTGPGEYSGRGRPERVTSPRTPVPAPEVHRTPAEISQIEEIASVLADKLMGQSTTRMRREVRPLKWSLGAVIAAVIGGAGWLTSQASAWQESQRNQWAVEAKQLEQDEAMSAHLAEPHVSPEQIAGLETRLAKIEERLDGMLEQLERLEKPAAKRGSR